MKLNNKLAIFSLFTALILFRVELVQAGISAPQFYGVVTSQTGAPVSGATITQRNNGGAINTVTGTDENGNPTSSYDTPVPASSRSTTTDSNGGYTMGRKYPEFSCLTNMQYFSVSVPNGSCQSKIDDPGNNDAYRRVDFVCNINPGPPPPPPPPTPPPPPPTPPPPPPACDSSCTSNDQCLRNGEGCTECVAGQCRIPPACNVSCSNDAQCEKAKDGCTSCLPSNNGAGKVCRPPAACNVTCVRDDQCAGAKDGCTSCLPSDAGTGNVCRPVAACNVACTKDGQCAGAKDGCTACVSGSCRVPPACGTACTTKAECSGSKDGCSECAEGTCTDYNANMCKCDGIVADLTYPSSAFKFEAFGKVEGGDVKKAEIADITFRLTKDNQVIAKSNPITPELVENSANKLRFKAAWQTPPPPVSKGAAYRVFADVRCKPKRIVADASRTSSPVPLAVKSFTPKGLELIAGIVNNLFGNSNQQVKKMTTKVLSFFGTSTVNAQGANLQLQTLKFVKLMDTDNCRFVMFKYDETLF